MLGEARSGGVGAWPARWPAAMASVGQKNRGGSKEREEGDEGRTGNREKIRA